MLSPRFSGRTSLRQSLVFLLCLPHVAARVLATGPSRQLRKAYCFQAGAIWGREGSDGNVASLLLIFLLAALRVRQVKWCALVAVPLVVPALERRFLILTSIACGVPGHNRGRVVETPLLARTRGGNVGGARHRRFWMLWSLVLCWRLHFPVAGMRESENGFGPATRSFPVESMPYKICRPLPGPTEGQRLCYTDLGQMVHVLIGSVSCGEVMFAPEARTMAQVQRSR